MCAFVRMYACICMDMEVYTCDYAGIYRCMCAFVSASVWRSEVDTVCLPLLHSAILRDKESAQLN